MNDVFLSYAGPDHDIAEELAEAINQKLADTFRIELVEDRKEGDTTFTEKVVRYFRRCNVFLVLLTKESLTNQFVNQEWGYAKCLKELGQIQVILNEDVHALVEGIENALKLAVQRGTQAACQKQGLPSAPLEQLAARLPPQQFRQTYKGTLHAVISQL